MATGNIIFSILFIVWCNFDHGLCSGLNQSSSDDFDWTLGSGSTPSSFTGPSSGQGGSGYVSSFCSLLYSSQLLKEV